MTTDVTPDVTRSQLKAVGVFYTTELCRAQQKHLQTEMVVQTVCVTADLLFGHAWSDSGSWNGWAGGRWILRIVLMIRVWSKVKVTELLLQACRN